MSFDVRLRPPAAHLRYESADPAAREILRDALAGELGTELNVALLSPEAQR